MKSASTHESSSSYAALSWLIRGTGAFIAIVSAAGSALTVVVMSVGAFKGHAIQDLTHSCLMFLFMLLPVITMGTLTLVGYCMWRRVDKTAVANFAFIFAVLVARGFYYSLPPHLGASINAHLWIFFQDPSVHAGSSYRGIWSFCAFILFYILIKACLMQALDLDPNSRTPDSSDDSTPEYPQKSPLIQL